MKGLETIHTKIANIHLKTTFFSKPKYSGIIKLSNRKKKMKIIKLILENIIKIIGHNLLIIF